MAVCVGEGVPVTVPVVVEVGVLVGACEGVNVGGIVVGGIGVRLCAHTKPPPNPIANKSSPKGTRRINQRRMISILDENEIPRKRPHSKIRRQKMQQDELMAMLRYQTTSWISRRAEHST